MKFSALHFILTVSLINGASAIAARMVLTLYALDLGAQPLTVGLLMAAFSFVPMLIVLPAGLLADRYGARWPLLISGAIGAVGLLLPYLIPNIAAMLLASAMIGFSSGVYQILMQNLVGLLSEPQHRVRNFANFSVMRSACNFIGPLIGGFAIQHSGAALACVYLAVITAIPIVMLLFRGGAMRGGVKREQRAQGGGALTLLKQPHIRRMLLTTSLLNSGSELYQFYMPVYTHSIDLSPAVIGAVLAMYAAAAFVMRSAIPYLVARYKDEQLLVRAFFVGAICLAIIPLIKNAVLLGIISFVFGLGMGASQPVISMLMFSNSPAGRSGETMGLRMTVLHSTKLLGPLAFGALGSAFGLYPVFWTSALMMSVGGLASKSKNAG